MTFKIISKFILLITFAKGVLSPQIHYSCLSIDECKSAFTSKYYCNIQLTCEHLPISYSVMEIIGLVIVTLLVTITNTGGVGAGTVIVPTLMVFLKFIVTDAIPHARITVMCGSIITFVMVGLARSRSDKSKFETSYNLAAAMSPLLLGGSQIGVMFAIWLPSSVTGSILGLYLIISLVQTFRRGKKEIKKEKKAKKLNNIRSPTTESLPTSTYIDASRLEDSGSVTLTRTSSNIYSIENAIPKLNLDLCAVDQIKSKWQMVLENAHNFFVILLSMCIIVASSLIRGGRGIESVIGIKLCTRDSWLVLSGTQLTFLALSYISYKSNQTVFTPEDVGISPRSTVPRKDHHKVRLHLLASSYIVGIMAGLLGIGGGLVIGLYMMAMGLSMSSTSSFSNFIVLVSSMATTLQFAVLGDLNFKNSYQFAAISLIGSFLGNSVFRPIILKTQKHSIIVWLVFGVLCVAIVVLPAELIKRAIQNPKGATSFGLFC